MKAMILAAGKGTRVRPITYTIPKPLIPILQKPVMEFLLELLRQHGFDEISDYDKQLYEPNCLSPAERHERVSIFWALLLLSAQSKVELSQEEFYQDIKIRTLEAE